MSKPKLKLKSILFNFLILEWSPWESWGSCSKSCNATIPGLRQRERNCVLSQSVVEEEACVAVTPTGEDGVLQTGDCGTHLCPESKVNF